MPYVFYTGFKKNFGPLKKKWMTKPVSFKDNVSEEIDRDTCDAILRSMPTLFIEVVKTETVPEEKPVEKKKTTGRKKSAGRPRKTAKRTRKNASS